MGFNIGAPLAGFLKFASMIGFVSCTAFLISINLYTFKRIFTERNKYFWTLFLFSCFAGFMVVLVIFSFLFEKNSPVKRVIVFRKGRPVLNFEEIKTVGNVEQIEPIEALENYLEYRKKESESGAEQINP